MASNSPVQNHQHQSLKNYARMSRKKSRVGMADMAVWSYENHRKMYSTSKHKAPVKKNSTSSRGKFYYG